MSGPLGGGIFLTDCTLYKSYMTKFRGGSDAELLLNTLHLAAVKFIKHVILIIVYFNKIQSHQL